MTNRLDNDERSEIRIQNHLRGNGAFEQSVDLSMVIRQNNMGDPEEESKGEAIGESRQRAHAPTDSIVTDGMRAAGSMMSPNLFSVHRPSDYPEFNDNDDSSKLHIAHEKRDESEKSITLLNGGGEVSKAIITETDDKADLRQ